VGERQDPRWQDHTGTELLPRLQGHEPAALTDAADTFYPTNRTYSKLEGTLVPEYRFPPPWSVDDPDLEAGAAMLHRPGRQRAGARLRLLLRRSRDAARMAKQDALCCR
jgi:hypothetical protein